MIRILATIAAALAAFAGSAAAVAQAVVPGVYSNVRLSPVSGDLGGMEIEVRRRGAGYQADFVWCEGWCNNVVTVPLTIRAGRFTFSYREPLTDAAGNSVPPNVTRMEGRFVRGGVVLRALGDRGAAPVSLERRRSRYGLNIARETEAEARRR